MDVGLGAKGGTVAFHDSVLCHDHYLADFEAFGYREDSWRID